MALCDNVGKCWSDYINLSIVGDVTERPKVVAYESIKICEGDYRGCVPRPITVRWVILARLI